MSLITRAAPVTFWLAIGAFIIWLFVGITLGIFAALRRGKWQDRLIMGVSLVGYSLPSFFFGLLLICLRDHQVEVAAVPVVRRRRSRIPSSSCRR